MVRNKKEEIRKAKKTLLPEPFRTLHEEILAASKKLKIDFERTNLIPHKQKRGVERERIVETFLTEFLPKKFSVGRGFTFSARNQISPEEDVVIYDELNNPLLSRFTTLGLFPIESVYAVVEVKSLLDKRELEDSFDKIKAVKEQPREGGFTKTLKETVVYPPPPPPIGIVFAFKSTRLATLKKNLEKFQEKEHPSCWTNLICVHDEGVIFFGNKENLSLSLQIEATMEPVILDSREDALYHFYNILEGYLNSAPKRIVNMKAYAGVSSETSWIQEALDSRTTKGFHKVTVIGESYELED